MPDCYIAQLRGYARTCDLIEVASKISTTIPNGPRRLAVFKAGPTARPGPSLYLRGKGSPVVGWESMANVTAGDEGGRTVRLTAWVEGRVQGVGFRYWVGRKAAELDLAGSATNLADGSVEVVAEGSEDACRGLLAALASGAGPGRVTRVTQRWGAPRGDLSGFVAR